MLISNHPFMSLSQDFAEVCKPLAGFQVHHITFVKQYKDGSRVTLCNKPQWLEDYYNLKLYGSSLFENQPGEYSSGFGVWVGEYDLDVYRHGREYFDTAHSITVTEPVNDGCEFYFFALSNKYLQETMYLANHMDVLHHFILYFKDKCRSLLLKAEKHRFRLQEKIAISDQARELSIHAAHQQTLSDVRNKFFQNTPVHHFSFDSGEDAGVRLTQREIHCASYLLQNKTAEETAALMGGLSRRTVESYLDNIRLKLDCANKLELIAKLQKNKFFSSIR